MRAGVAHIRVHGLRHTFGSQMAMAGADPFAIMKAMGHTDIKTTMIYVSLGKSHIREQVEKLNGIGISIPSTDPFKRKTSGMTVTLCRAPPAPCASGRLSQKASV